VVHGLRIELRGDWPEVLDEIGLDFAWFSRPEEGRRPHLEIEVQRRTPDYDRLGDLEATYVTPRNVVFQREGGRVVDYFGRAVSVLDRSGTRLVVQGEDRHLVHEAAYQFLLARIGEHLDARGLPRIHALGLVGGQGGVAVMLPSGGGKTTLALRALREDGVRLLSEDTPLLDRRGMLHPFPLRIGVNAIDAEKLPEGSVRELERMEFHPKLVLDVDAFADRIEASPHPLRHLVIGRRSLGRDARLEPIPRSATLGPLLREAVIGVGVYQGMEFVLQRGMRDVLGNLGVARTRARCCAAGLVRARAWSLTLGRDHERNWAAIAPLLD
jgi:hypothetical protein